MNSIIIITPHIHGAWLKTNMPDMFATTNQLVDLRNALDTLITALNKEGE